LDLHLEFDSSGKLSTKIYDKRDDFDFKIINFPYLCSNIPTSPAYGVYISQLIRYARACTNYSDFIERHKNLRTRLLSQNTRKCVSKGLLLNSFSNTKIWLKSIQYLLRPSLKIVFCNFSWCFVTTDYRYWHQHIYTDYHHLYIYAAMEAGGLARRKT